MVASSSILTVVSSFFLDVSISHSFPPSAQWTSIVINIHIYRYIYTCNGRYISSSSVRTTMPTSPSSPSSTSEIPHSPSLTRLYHPFMHCLWWWWLRWLRRRYLLLRLVIKLLIIRHLASSDLSHPHHVPESRPHSTTPFCSPRSNYNRSSHVHWRWWR